MSVEQIAKNMDIAFLALLDQLLKVGYFITALEMIDMTCSHFAWEREKLLQGINLLGVKIQLKQGRIYSVLLLCIPL